MLRFTGTKRTSVGRNKDGNLPFERGFQRIHSFRSMFFLIVRRGFCGIERLPPMYFIIVGLNGGKSMWTEILALVSAVDPCVI